MILETNNGVKLNFSNNAVFAPDGTIGQTLSNDGTQSICAGETNDPLILIDGNMNLIEVNLDGYYIIHESKVDKFVKNKFKAIERDEKKAEEDDLVERITKSVLEKLEENNKKTINVEGSELPKELLDRANKIVNDAIKNLMEKPH